MKEVSVDATGVRFSVLRGGKEVGHAYLYMLNNDLHNKPFGLLEDVYVDSNYRGEGVATELLEAVLKKAQEKCYKLIATSRNDGTRTAVHEWYTRLGFDNYGTEFRLNF
ncbi:GNAT family N-acetyltransferase [Candidatus Nomurabacteria bacterium]|nr:GNAT family N-acetyltransferase [Candidatus Kaiserbacteria bacterium]MCB9811129.1 GNAT family N-acetyltransferase [Candidatus Nomurabacteria bacterium]MCB9814435.1 GNAT family N-acetyltransferase [Candidatus Nomurabacteria bacterium]